MKSSVFMSRPVRWLMVITASGILPQFFLRCDRAALNIQRGFFQGIGDNLSDLLFAFSGVAV